MSSTASTTEEESVLPDTTVSESARSESDEVVSTQEEEEKEEEEKKDPPRDETPHTENEELNSLASTVSSSQDSQDSSDGTIHVLLPKVNCPEKIVVCLDMSKEMTSRHVSSRDGSQFSPLSLAKRVIEIFVRTKSRMDRKHQFALVILHDAPTLMLSELLLSPHLFLDALYVHQPPADDNQSIEIFNAICDLDRKCLSYVYEVATNVTMFHNHMAKLLAHPLQRPAQSDTYYKLQSNEEVS
ncbi:PREDICTED: BRISC and BRCA1-A complex member 1-like [Branchiostoma belcheri]|uniref:BRISC and BRCA1-A complex member 1 n=1 Tax=Branchiostoma belcheri TaxID=7741 RepID=A0A6P4YPA6_BRABE|nr:PREDICTED: BRISC and BRCA1-A complex member 1-like [Branchiostoma belcheri]